MSSRIDTHPIAFAAGEAIADQASAALVMWETASAVKWRTYPHASLAVLIGLHDMLGHMIDEMREGEADETEAANDG